MLLQVENRIEVSDRRVNASLTRHGVTVRPAWLKYVCSTWALYERERSRAQADPDIGLTESVMEDYFRGADGDFPGRQVTHWRDWILSHDFKTGLGVYNAFIPESETPIAVARFTQEGEERHIRNMYVAQRAQGRGVSKAMLEKAKIIFDGQPFKVDVARHNLRAQFAYLGMGFEFTGERSEYEILGRRVVRREMIHPGN